MYRYIVSIKVRTATQKSSLQLITSNLLISVYISVSCLQNESFKGLGGIYFMACDDISIYLKFLKLC